MFKSMEQQSAVPFRPTRNLLAGFCQPANNRPKLVQIVAGLIQVFGTSRADGIGYVG
jgi:hypothetical protein